MNILKQLGDLLVRVVPFRRHGAGDPPPSVAAERGILVFANTAEVIQAERLLEAEGLPVRVMGPPPQLRTGCDMVVVFPILMEPLARAVLEKANIAPLQVVSLRDTLLEPVSLFHARRLGRWLMVRAANMKMTCDVETGRIVNISGGGCPDVPYLAALLTGNFLPGRTPSGERSAEAPRLHGKTLCSYSLQKAFAESERLMSQPEALPAAQDIASPKVLSEMLNEIPDGNFSLPRDRKRSWLICGSVPDASFPLCRGRWRLEGEQLVPLDGQAGGQALPVCRGTPALLAAALAAGAAGRDNGCAPWIEALLTGDEGTGHGSRRLYRHLSDELLPAGALATARRSGEQKSGLPEGLTFHYLLPDVDGHNRILMAMDAVKAAGGRRPFSLADAGFMYAAKMSGYADQHDLFTPDAGELAFLADEKAPHPFYTRGYLLSEERDLLALARRAFDQGNAARYLLVKGERDLLVHGKDIVGEVGAPCVPAMEAIGGTGDMVAGILTGLLSLGVDVEKAALLAARCARLAGALVRPDPSTQVAAILPHIPTALKHFQEF